MDLKECTSENTLPFIIQHVKVKAKVLSVYDGDTITVAFDPFKCGVFFHHNVRFLGINAPEIHTKRKKEKEAGKAAGDYLRKLIEGKIVTLIIKENKDKYGRTSAIVIVDGLNLCDHMVEMGYARVYDGGARKPWFSDEEEKAF